MNESSKSNEGSVDDTEKAVAGLLEKLTAVLDGFMKNLKAVIAERGLSKEAESRLGQLDANIGELGSELKKAISEVNETLENIENRIKAIEEGLKQDQESESAESEDGGSSEADGSGSENPNAEEAGERYQEKIDQFIEGLEAEYDLNDEQKNQIRAIIEAGLGMQGGETASEEDPMRSLAERNPVPATEVSNFINGLMREEIDELQREANKLPGLRAEVESLKEQVDMLKQQLPAQTETAPEPTAPPAPAPIAQSAPASTSAAASAPASTSAESNTSQPAEVDSGSGPRREDAGSGNSYKLERVPTHEHFENQVLKYIWEKSPFLRGEVDENKLKQLKAVLEGMPKAKRAMLMTAVAGLTVAGLIGGTAVATSLALSSVPMVFLAAATATASFFGGRRLVIGDKYRREIMHLSAGFDRALKLFRRRSELALFLGGEQDISKSDIERAVDSGYKRSQFLTPALAVVSAIGAPLAALGFAGSGVAGSVAGMSV